MRDAGAEAAHQERIRAAVRASGAHLSDEQVRKLFIYAEHLLQWNERIQLTATRDAAEFIDRHVADALQVAVRLPAAVERLIDVGSGGGLPGVVLAIAAPALEVTLLEPVRKKHAFLAAARRRLGLGNLRALPERDEDHDPGVGYDAAVARAVWSVDVWLARGQRLVRPGGWVLAMEGRDATSLPAGAERLAYELPGGRQRALIRLQRPAG